MSQRQFIFVIAPARSGTGFLAELLRQNLQGAAHVIRARQGWRDPGVHGPDGAHHMRFGAVGNDTTVRAFWQQKIQRLIRSKASVVAETDPGFARAGLIENIAPLTQAGRVDLVVLGRETSPLMWSLMNRLALHVENARWLTALDPRLPNVIVDPKPFNAAKVPGQTLWYIHEMRTRAEYYRLLLRGTPNIRLHECSLEQITTRDGAGALLAALGHGADDLALPGPVNTLRHTYFNAGMQARCEGLVTKFRVDPVQIAAEYFEAGRRLELGPKQRLSAPPDARVH